MCLLMLHYFSLALASFHGLRAYLVCVSRTPMLCEDVPAVLHQCVHARSTYGANELHFHFKATTRQQKLLSSNNVILKERGRQRDVRRMKYTVTIIIFLLGKGVYLFISVFVFLLPIHISQCCCGFIPGTSSTYLICITAVILMELCRNLKTMQNMYIQKNKQSLHVIVHLVLGSGSALCL